MKPQESFYLSAFGIKSTETFEYVVEEFFVGTCNKTMHVILHLN